MYANGQTLIHLFESKFPKYLAMPEDKIGLQAGTLQKEIKRVMIALEATEAVVDEAAAKEIDLLIVHHALIFRPLKHLRTDTPSGRVIEKLLKHDIAVYAAHTNLDIAEGGVNDLMAEALGLTECKPLEITYEEPLYKLVVFIPEDHHDQVLQALSAAGAGWIGNYSHCTFNLNGTGTFMPREGTNPFIGSQGKLEKVKEVRLETIVPESLRNKAVQKMIQAHPYEEPAYDLYPLALPGKKHGLGRIGRLPEELTLDELARKVKQAFAVDAVRVTGDGNRRIRKAAVLGGAGAKYVGAAQFAGADVLITGDIDYHTAQDALAAGMCLIDPGHHAEQMMKRGVANTLKQLLSDAKYSTEVIVSETNTDPFRFV